jgi:organic radical activating enzyme
MTSVREAIRRLFTPVQPLPPGTYHYQAPPEDPRNYRLHLRLEPDGSGVLIVNAATVLHLNRTAAEYAYHLVQGTPKQQVLRSLSSRYRVGESQVDADYRKFLDRIDALITTPDLDPVAFLDFDRQAPFSGEISAPYRLDCALTYRLPTRADPESAPTKRVTRELSTAEWEAILDKAWQAGIPHVVFTGGEPTLRADLLQLIMRAETNGQVTGLITDGLRLTETDYLDQLLQTGLDHLLIILHEAEPAAWEAVRNAIQADLFTAVHLTVTGQNSDAISGTIERLAGMGLAHISLSAAAPELNPQLQSAREVAANLDLSLVWNLPVPYSALNPVALEVDGQEIPEGAGRAWLYVEPDGDVLPAQGVSRVLGNFLSDPWEDILRSARAFGPERAS